VNFERILTGGWRKRARGGNSKRSLKVTEYFAKSISLKSKLKNRKKIERPSFLKRRSFEFNLS